ncbi:MAG: hypothetical protein ACJAVT_001599 [Yoonia sp.]|jgi:hypothetical protein
MQILDSSAETVIILCMKVDDNSIAHSFIGRGLLGQPTLDTAAIKSSCA